MVNEINSACCGIADLPSRRQRTELFTIDVAKIPAKQIYNRNTSLLGLLSQASMWHTAIPWSLRKCIVSETWDVQLESLIPNGFPNLHIQHPVPKWPRTYHSLHFSKFLGFNVIHILNSNRAITVLANINYTSIFVWHKVLFYKHQLVLRNFSSLFSFFIIS